jgi:hypothetical protein
LYRDAVVNRLRRRQRAALAIFVAFAVSGIGVALADPEGGGPPGVTLDLNPHPPVANNQALTVTGQGFASGVPQSGVVYQAADLPDGTTAIGLTQVPFTTNASGTFTATIQVTQVFNASGSGGANFPVDCSAANVVCLVEATTDSGSAFARHSLTFGAGTTTTSTVPATTTSTLPGTTTSTLPGTTTSSLPGTTTSTVPGTTTSTVPGTTTSSLPGTTTSTLPGTTTSTLPGTTTSVVPGTTTTGVPGTTTTTTPFPAGDLCSRIRAAKAQVNSQIDAASAFVNQSVPAAQRGRILAQLEDARARANAQLDTLLVGCPS